MWSVVRELIKERLMLSETEIFLFPIAGQISPDLHTHSHKLGPQSCMKVKMAERECLA